MIGKVIKGKYRIIDEIGRGSLATAYLARDTTSNQVVILKHIHTEHVAEGRFSQRFQPEARLLNMLSSPQAARVLDYGEEDGRPFVVSEYVQGRTLDQVLEQEGPLDVRRTLEIAKQIALGLVDAHAKSIIHLDLRPPNIMLSPEDHVKVLDFGIAQATKLSALAAAGTLGKPHYLSPEQVTAERVDARADIYGLGVIVFELLTGQLPYDAPSAAEIVQAHLREPIPSLHQLNANIPPEVDDLVTKCLTKKPQDRYQSAAEFLEAIDQTLRNIAARQEASPGIHADLAGQTLGAYRVIEQIGRGGMAVVYKAYEPGLDRYVAIKVLPQYFAHDPDFAARFEREAKAIAQLNHPNILSIFGSGQDAGLSYIVMRYVEAGTLRAKLGEPLPLKTIIEILTQVGKALDYAHERGIVHRDVKPSNVLMAEDNWALLCDFGLARMMESSVRLTKSGVGIGTPAYMSPEQGRGLKVDARSDVYSLGVVLYEMLTGQVPYTAETPMAVVLQHITAPLPMPTLVNPDLPAAVERVILKALAKDPDDRYQTAGEMMAALETVMAKAPAAERPAQVEPVPVIAEPTPAPAPPVPLADPLAKEGRPPTWVWGVAGLCALLIVVGLVLLATRGSEPAPTPEATEALAAASTLPATATVTQAPAATQTPEPTPTLAAVVTDTPAATEAAVLAPSPHPGLDVRMRLRLTTTSDWAQLTVLSGDEIVDSNTIESGGVTIHADMEGRVIRLLQKLERGEAGHTIFVVQDLTLSKVSEDQDLSFQTDKGCLGEMTAEVYSLATGVPVLVARFVTEECEGGELFEVSAAALLAESPPPLSATVATQVWEQDGSTMVYVPGGTFWMGSSESDPIFGPNEVPRHQVHLDAFWIDQTEVTNAQYRRCVDDGACEPPRSVKSFTRDVYYGDPQFDDYPVLKVTWLQADAYCRWVGKRLPTEAEWEKAARGTDRRTYPWGETFDGERLNFCDVNCDNADAREEDWDDGYADTAPVGSYPLGASAYGALDMAGNLREWVANGFSPYSDDPLSETNPIGPLASESRVDRGGSAGDGSWASRVTYRGVDDPSIAYVDIGFRCAYSEVAPSPPQPAVPEGGAGLMVCQDATPPQICQVDVANKVTQLTDNPDFRSVTDATWSHDGQEIVFSDVPDDSPGAALFVANADGSDVRQITSGESLDTQPVWSPDGDWIAFHRSCSLWLIHPDGSDAFEFLEQADGFCVQTPVWSPDGQRIAFLIFRDSSLEIWITNRDGSDPHVVYTIERPADGGYLSWSPDGQQIGCWYNTGGATTWGLLVSADGSGMAQAVDWEPFWWLPTFWPPWGVDYSDSPEVSVDLGPVNQERGLVQADFGDGRTAPVNVEGKEARVTVHNPTGGHYFYFRVHRTFLYARETPLQVKVEYLDRGDHRIGLSYDSADANDPEERFKVASPDIQLTDSGQWKTFTFDLPDAYFGGRQHRQFDFRIGTGDHDMVINSVSVTKLPLP